MLSEREIRALQKIEQQISEEDPRFAATMRRPLPSRRYRLVFPYDAIIVVAALSAVLCLALSAVGSGVVAALLAAATFYLRPRHFSPRAGRSSSRHHRTIRRPRG